MLASLHVNIACVAEISALQVYRGERERERDSHQPTSIYIIYNRKTLYIYIIIIITRNRNT